MDSLYSWSDLTKIGVGLTGLGAFFFFLGIVMLLDSVLLTMGNLLFVTGIGLIMGPKRFSSFFRSRPRASFFFFLGLLMVLFRWCFIGLCLQFFGGLNLFGNFIPMVLRVLESLPIIGSVLRRPEVRKVLNFLQLDGRRNESGRNV